MFFVQVQRCTVGIFIDPNVLGVTWELHNLSKEEKVGIALHKPSKNFQMTLFQHDT